MLLTHDLHPALIHAPLALLPAAALVDVLATLRRRDRRLDRMGARLWWATAGAGLGAGLAGMAASQEIDLADDRARDVMFLHGFGNFTVVLTALGLAAWRSRNRADLTSASAGVLAAGAAIYGAYLGGELVYTHGAGVKRPGGRAAANPPLFSREAPARLAVDALRGLGWLFDRARLAVSGRERVDRTALGPIATAGTGAEPPAAHQPL